MPNSAADLNPYQPPRISDPQLAYEHRGIGVWRDGDLIVMHELAELPPYCVKTGVPTRRQAVIEADWLIQTGKFYIDAPRIRIPLAERWRITGIWCKQQIVRLAFILFFTALAVAMLIHNWMGWQNDMLEVWFSVGIGLFVILLTVWACVVGDPLRSVRSEGPYHWLRGADHRFLDRLPQWEPADG